MAERLIGRKPRSGRVPAIWPAGAEKGDRAGRVVALILAVLVAAIATVWWSPGTGSASAPASPAAAPAEQNCPPKKNRKVYEEAAKTLRDNAREGEAKAKALEQQAKELDFPAPLVPPTSEDLRKQAKNLRNNAALRTRDANKYEKLAKDPPDPNFQVLATPERLRIPPAGGGPRALRRALDAHNKTLGRLGAFLGAATTALERSAGAQAAGSATWMRTQHQAAARYNREAATLLTKLPSLRGRVRRAFAAADVSIHPDARTLAAIKRDVRRHGLPELRAAFRRLGVPDSELAPIKQAILGMSLRELRRANPFAGGAADKIDRRAAAALRSYAGDLENANCLKGYTFNTGTVTVYDNRPTFWTDMVAQGSFCSVGPPLGQPWHVWGSSVSYYVDEDGMLTMPNTIPADGTITFDGDGKKASVAGSFPWFVLDINLLMNQDPPEARIWLWDGQLAHQKEVGVPLVSDPNCQPAG